jgi:hypothetical protein
MCRLKGHLKEIWCDLRSCDAICGRVMTSAGVDLWITTRLWMWHVTLLVIWHEAYMLQHTATHCNTPKKTATPATHVWTRHVALIMNEASMLHHTATHCNTLQHTAMHCNTLQHTLWCSVLQCVTCRMTYLILWCNARNTLQYSVTQCATVRHIVSPCAAVGNM